MHYLILTIYTNPKNTKRIIFFHLSFISDDDAKLQRNTSKSKQLQSQYK